MKMAMKWLSYLRTVATVKGGFVGRPTTLLPVKPECIRADSEFQVCHPTRTDINHTRYTSRH